MHEKSGPRPPGPNDIRLRKLLDATLTAPDWPEGFVMRLFEHRDAQALHALLDEAFDDGAEGAFDEWWEHISGDAEFDPDLCFLVIDGKGLLTGAALCWTSGFVKDLAVHPDSRRRGIGEALMRHVFLSFRYRGAAHVDLKTNTVRNTAAFRLYERLGMVPVAWEG
ncbi:MULTISPECIES: GNAT family N-acetyltransferase [unclassified Mesorhizobium]|uniref:GNAT family N-acetyltransferase n=1 Tax=unclassified Mesorhizobium TaxID=325217 RepID=UPI000FCAA216|nr:MULTISPECIES: GNAT family N-acetyltransferase [unclassified Mesorhizobium]TIT75792.1 MAG: GNAT family N-acetyltransferase [Mesorhizobium sp.]TGP19197.1 GNAT family N-acetyltransferase [Mesorhizobium sp. M1D.F.Ca.ET.231.01.1.1]TGP25823.1 GNAT family N-acetyltransferase [Mesorhizobium sp. M1D.F.Ca.ET.234.01.1.1]TGS40634.1 GNAT family N-acetyltransferase [Mesorhizobium sp. M1D.F.Ca.ET.184.01.1.1]TGS59079.1 GNAT family N-acetyltransferase [Mesorhizobium sp. M1D.F.Ca.ET.183.01.1.1]